MKYKLEKFVKFWPSINKWVVAYTVPELGFISNNAFHTSLDKADDQALKNITKHIKYQQELKAIGETSIINVTI